MSLSIRLQCEPVRTLAAAAILAGYMGVGTAMSRPIRMLFIQNLTDVTLMFSLNGIDDNFPLAAQGYIMLDISSNKTNTQGFYFAEGQRVYVKQSGVPATGAVWVTTFYGAD